MKVQRLTLGGRRYVLLAEKEYRRLQRSFGDTNPSFGAEAMRELKAYQKTGKAKSWRRVKRRLGL